MTGVMGYHATTMDDVARLSGGAVNFISDPRVYFEFISINTTQHSSLGDKYKSYSCRLFSFPILSKLSTFKFLNSLFF